MRKLIILTIAALSLTVSSAMAASGGDEGKMTFSIGLAQGSGEFAEPASAVTSGNPIIVPNNILGGPSYGPMGELGANVQWGYMFSPDYAFAVGFDYRIASQKLEPTTNAPAGTTTLKITATEWQIRAGGDRVGAIGDRFKRYMGPGLEYASGKAKFENLYAATGPTASVKGEPTNKFGVNGRVGGVMMLNNQVGIYGQLGNSVGLASVKDTGGKTTWYYSTFQSAWGLQFAFGGK